MIPAPNPCTKRPTTSTGIDGASPPISSPAVNVEMPHARAGANPRRSASSPPSMMPIIEPRKKAVTTTRKHHPMEVGLDVGEDADHRQRLRCRDHGAGHEAELHRAPREAWLPVITRRSRWIWLPARPVV